MPRIRSWILPLLLLAAHSGPARADALDDYLKSAMQRHRIPGLSVAVVREGKVVKAKGYGQANVELNVPATEDTVYQIGSVTKQFTATALMMLVEEGKVSLDDTVTKHLSGLPEAWSGVTLRHLLTHTSGIKSYTSLPGYVVGVRNERTKEQMIAMVSTLPLEFQPGEKWSYNNTGYFLLGMVIEKASGKSYGDFLTERIFKPLEMTRTRVNDLRDVIPNRASGYEREGDALRNAEYVSMTQPYAAGAMVSTVTDLAKWDAALYTEKLLKRSSLDQMWTPVKLKDGKPATYGFGWSVDTVRGHRLVSHGGGIPGFTSFLARYVDDRLTVIVLCNTMANPEALAAGVARQYLPDLVEKPIEDKEPKVTEKLREVLTQVAEGKLDANAFTPEARGPITAGAKGAGEFLKSLGPLKSLSLLERGTEGKNRTYRYRVLFGDNPVIIRCMITEDGLFAGLGLSPD